MSSDERWSDWFGGFLVGYAAVIAMGAASGASIDERTWPYALVLVGLCLLLALYLATRTPQKGEDHDLD